MRAALTRLDDTLIDRVFQPLVDWMSEHLSLDCFLVARVCTDMAALAWVVSQAGDVVTALGSADSSPATLRFVLLVLGLGAITVLRTLFQHVGSGGKAAARANPLRAGMQVHRFMCQFWLVGLLAKTAAAPFGLAAMGLLAVGMCATLAAYFGACSNPPPKRHAYMAGGPWKLAPLPRG